MSDDNSDNMMSIEYGQFIPLLSMYLPASLNLPDFKEFLSNESLISLNEYADNLAMTLPKPRVTFYESSNYDDIQRSVTQYANSVTEALGFYPI